MPEFNPMDLSSATQFIEGAKTSTAAFVAPVAQGSVEPKLISSWKEFTQVYGVGSDRGLAGVNLAEAVQGFFLNGGTRCYVAGTDGDGLAGYTAALAALEKVREVNIVVVPELWQSETDAPGIAKAVAGHCVRAGNQVALLHTTQGASAEDARKTPGLFGLDETEAAFTSLYYPWIKVPGADGTARVVPPAGHVAGVWARTDAEKGVFKAPANQNLRGADGLQTELSDDENGQANEAGVNCLRTFPDRGVLVWGARTLSTDNDWRYLNVRRLANFLTDSIKTSTTWAAEEPNDQQLWSSLKASVTSFLTDQWRQGALLGRTPEEALYVTCDHTNNKPDTIQAGQVVLDIGIAAVRPAEFIKIRIVLPAAA
ncbi:phage tail sheath subtilisin-like domain-containing protein [Streptomyces anulatus]|uniref:phage tail sheath family protein n=1 Tax=Streptomyces anulatus TaxID=1892 RepID=UPI00324CD355